MSPKYINIYIWKKYCFTVLNLNVFKLLRKKYQKIFYYATVEQKPVCNPRMRNFHICIIYIYILLL